VKRIYKYHLEIEDKQTILLPVGAEILSLHVQHGRLCLWSIIDTDNEIVPRKIIICGTGYPADDVSDMQFLGSFQLNEGYFVGHVFIDKPALHPMITVINNHYLTPTQED